MDGKDAIDSIEIFNMDIKSVYVIEASPSRRQEIAKTYPLLNVVPYAIWTHDGFIDFNEVKQETPRANKGMGSIRDRHDGAYDSAVCEKITVPCMKASTWLESIDGDLKFDMHFVKIDTEGCDLDVLMSFGSYLNNIRCVQLEGQKNVIWKEQKTQQDIDLFLSSAGYKEVWRREWTHAFDTVWIREDLVL
jgi:FkbM family methyltransferase